MQHTTNYNLSQYDATDRVTRDAFNADNLAIDAALKSVSDAAGTAQSTATSALAAAVAGCRVVVGTYTGDGMSSRTIDLGAQPKSVYVCMQNGYVASTYTGTGTSRTAYCGGLAMPNNPVLCTYSSTDYTILSVSGTGFTVHWSTPATRNIAMATNLSGQVYHYIAFF